MKNRRHHHHFGEPCNPECYENRARHERPNQIRWCPVCGAGIGILDGVIPDICPRCGENLPVKKGRTKHARQ